MSRLPAAARLYLLAGAERSTIPAWIENGVSRLQMAADRRSRWLAQRGPRRPDQGPSPTGSPSTAGQSARSAGPSRRSPARFAVPPYMRSPTISALMTTGSPNSAGEISSTAARLRAYAARSAYGASPGRDHSG